MKCLNDLIAEAKAEHDAMWAVARSAIKETIKQEEKCQKTELVFFTYKKINGMWIKTV